MKRTNPRFLFSHYPWDEEILLALSNSSPVFASKLNFTEILSDFNCGDFTFRLKGKNGAEFEISFHKTTDSINDFWNFLEEVVSLSEPLILDLFYAGIETFIYIEPAGKNDLRFAVLDTIELYKKERAGKILRYSYAECRVDIDIIINKKKFIKQFYNELFNIFDKYKNIAYFEPPVIDFDFWIKDSIKIRSYVKRKKADKSNK